MRFTVAQCDSESHRGGARAYLKQVCWDFIEPPRLEALACLAALITLGFMRRSCGIIDALAGAAWGGVADLLGGLACGRAYVVDA